MQDTPHESDGPDGRGGLSPPLAMLEVGLTGGRGLEHRGAQAVAAEQIGRNAAARVSPVLVVVARELPDLCTYLARTVTELADIRVTLDRRYGERRRHVEAHEPERRLADRRRRPGTDEPLHAYGYLVTRQQQPTCTDQPAARERMASQTDPNILAERAQTP